MRAGKRRRPVARHRTPPAEGTDSKTQLMHVGSLRLRRISHRPDGGNASPPTCFQEAAIHLKIGNFLSEEWGHPQGLRLYSTLATAKIGPCNKPRPGRRLTTKPLCPGSCSHWKTLPVECLHQRDRPVPRGRPQAVARDVRCPGRWDERPSHLAPAPCRRQRPCQRRRQQGRARDDPRRR